jgi:ankyrin repeat protein
LIYAASNGYADIIRVLFQYGCETALHAEDRDGWNAVIHAAANGHAPVVDMLVHAGAATVRVVLFVSGCMGCQ